MIKIITYGTYDMLHIGHINILTRAKAQGDYLIVGITSEDYDRSRGKLNVSQSQEERYEAIKQLDFVDEVIFETHKNQKQEDMLKYNIDKFVIGDDWIGKFDYLNDFTKVVYLPRTKGISSTQLRNEQMKPINIGIVGENRDSQRFIKEAKFVSNITIDAVFTLDKNYKNFLSSNIDAVYICLDIEMRYEYIKEALIYGKHVLCENPLAIEENQLQELFKIANKNNKLLLMAVKTAFAPAFNKLIEELQNGAIGEIKEIRATFTSLYEQRGYNQEYINNGATNLLMDYPYLLVHKLAGCYDSVDFIDQRNDLYDISNRAITKHKNDIIAISTVGIGIKSNSDAIISGTKGFVQIPAPWWLTREFKFKFEDVHKEYSFEYEFEGDGLRYMISEFSSLIQRGKIESQRLTQNDMIELNKIITEYNKRSKL
jgi:glycerol-3-phosphate cytidylyltransferase